MEKKIFKTTTFVSYAKDFKKEENWTWQNAYFELLGWKNTWQVPLEMDIESNAKHEAFLYLVVPSKDAERTRRWMEDLGYGKINEYDTNTLVVYPEWEEDVDQCIARFY